MKKIESFQVDHRNLNRGIYVSRKDYVGNEVLTTFDIRMTLPNREPVMNTAEIHTLEHLGATYLRNHETYADKTIYFGPMGCRTGFYLILKGDLESKDIVELITDLYTFMANYEGDIPGADDYSCGNYLDLNLVAAKYWAKQYLVDTLANLSEEHLVYPK